MKITTAPNWPFNNSTALLQAVTNIGVLNNGSNPDIVTTNLSYLFVPAASTSLLYDPDVHPVR